MIGELFVGELSINFFLQEFSNPLLTTIFIAITMLGDPFFWIIISAIFFWNGREKESMRIATIIFFNAVILGIIKYTVNRPRPNIPSLEEFTTKKAFPSGHVAILTSIYSFYQKKIKKREKIILILLILLNGISRLYLGVHYFSDIVFGIMLGYIIGKAIFKYEKHLEKIRLFLKKNSKKTIPLIIILGILIIIFLPQNLFLSIMLVGYFIGYLLHNKSVIKINKNEKIFYTIIGTIIIILLGHTATKTTPIISGLLFLISGLFITLIWPKIIKLNYHFKKNIY